MHRDPLTTTTYRRPISITTYEIENQYEHPDLDFDYIDALAEDVAEILWIGRVVEAAYQPGDGTRYGLLIVPLSRVWAARPRVKDGVVWDRHAVSGMKLRDGDNRGKTTGYYDSSTYLVSHVEHSCYPLMLGDRANVLAGSYVESKWDLPPTSAVSFAILFRAVSHHLGRFL